MANLPAAPGHARHVGLGPVGGKGSGGASQAGPPAPGRGPAPLSQHAPRAHPSLGARRRALRSAPPSRLCYRWLGAPLPAALAGPGGEWPPQAGGRGGFPHRRRHEAPAAGGGGAGRGPDRPCLIPGWGWAEKRGRGHVGAAPLPLPHAGPLPLGFRLGPARGAKVWPP